MADDTNTRREPSERANPTDPARVARRSLALFDADASYWEWDPLTGDGTTTRFIDELLGLPPGQRVDTVEALMSFVHPEDRARLRGAMIAYVASGSTEPFEIEYRLVRPDGGVRWLRSIGRTWVDPVGGRRLVIGTAVNITAAKLLEEELAQARRLEAIGRLAGGVAHDFNNLLTAIFASLHFASRVTGPELARELDTIRTAAERATKLTQQLLAFARKQVIQLVPIDVNEVVTRLEDMMHRLLGEDVTLTTRLAPSLWPIRGDATQLEQILVNLLTNAREAMPDGGPVTVETRNVEVAAGASGDVPAGAYACLVVRDAGAGIDQDARDHLFEPFFTTKPRGTGLGLASTYGIVTQLGGHVAVDTELGQGTSFVVYLPRIAEAAAADARAPEAEARVPATILVVEDDDLLRRGMVRGLGQLGYGALVARDGVEALAIARDHDGAIDLAIVDVIMPGMSGRALAEALAAVRPDTALLFASGHRDDVIARLGVLDPSHELIIKPFTIEQLATRIDGLLRAKRAP